MYNVRSCLLAGGVCKYQRLVQCILIRTMKGMMTHENDVVVSLII